MRTSALILDMDGVIVDSEPIHKQADVLTFKSLGLEVPISVLQQFAGTGADVFFRSVLDLYGVSADASKLRRLKNRLILELLAKDAPPVPGIIPLIDRAKRMGLSLAIASSSDKEVVTAVLTKIGIAGKFDCVVDGTMVSRGKPEPDIFLEAARRLGHSPLGCLVVEDSSAGARAAKAAGMRCIGLQNPLSGNQDLSSASVRIASLDEISESMLSNLR